jgi:hypothetical protein
MKARGVLRALLALGMGVATLTVGNGPAAAAPNNVVSTPPMGWASWNTFAAKINYNVIKGQVDALV